MKKAMANTRVSVKLRKTEYRDEWYLYIEAYPVFQKGSSTPQRVREYLNVQFPLQYGTNQKNHVRMRMEKLIINPNAI